MTAWLGYYFAVIVVTFVSWAGWCGYQGVVPTVPKYLVSLAARFGAGLLLLLPLIVLPGWIVASYAFDPTAQTYPWRLHGAALAGTVLATGWLVAFLLREYEAVRGRNQMRVDVLAALRTEIVTFVTKLDQQDLGHAAKVTQDQIRANGDKRRRFHPVPSRESPTTVYEAMSGEMKVVAPETLEVVLRFYAAHSDLRTFIDDFRSDAFARMPAERRAQAHVDLTQNRRTVLYWGLVAVQAIDLDITGTAKKLKRSGRNLDIVGDLV